MPDSREITSPLAGHMEARRIELGRTWREVAAAGGTTYETLRLVMIGKSVPRSLTKKSIELGLEWAPGSVDRVSQGQQPIPVQTPPASTETSVDEIMQIVDGLSGEAKRELLSRLVSTAYQDTGRERRYGA